MVKDVWGRASWWVMAWPVGAGLPAIPPSRFNQGVMKSIKLCVSPTTLTQSSDPGRRLFGIFPQCSADDEYAMHHSMAILSRHLSPTTLFPRLKPTD